MSLYAQVEKLQKQFSIPREDIFFIALNMGGVRSTVAPYRVRANLRLTNREICKTAFSVGELEHFVALPVNIDSEFSIEDEQLLIPGGIRLGVTRNLEEDTSDVFYWRRQETALNFNPNARSACAGCKFCYTSRLTPADREVIRSKEEIEASIDHWLQHHDMADLSHLVRLAVVTGNYLDEEQLCLFLISLKDVLTQRGFAGEMFYLGSQIVSRKWLERLRQCQPLTICFSLETFERREILRWDKRRLTIDEIEVAMRTALSLNFEVTFTWIAGFDSLTGTNVQFARLKQSVSRFPIVNVFQRHSMSDLSLLHPDASGLEYFCRVRNMIEDVFADTELRPIPWENYRSLWTLDYAGEPLGGLRIPY